MNPVSKSNRTWSDSSNHSSPYLQQKTDPYQPGGSYFTPLYQPQLTQNWSEDNMSACSSSFSNTPELEGQSLIEELLNSTSTTNMTGANALIADPQLFTTSTVSTNPGLFIYNQKQLVAPIYQSTSSPSQKYISRSDVKGFVLQQHYNSATAVAIHNSINDGTAVAATSYAIHPSTATYYDTPAMPPAYDPPNYQNIPSTTTYANNNYAYNPSMYSSSTHMKSNNTTSCHRTQHHYYEQKPQQFNHYMHLENSESAPSTSSSKIATTTTTTTTTSIDNTNVIKGKYACNEPGCNKVFPRSYNLKSHLRTHTKERPHRCKHSLCNWWFARIHDLKRHELQHTGEKPHACEFCHRTFSRSDALKRHWKVDEQCSQALVAFKLNNDGREPIGNRKRKARLENKKKQV